MAHNTHGELRSLTGKCLWCVCFVYSSAALLASVGILCSPRVSLDEITHKQTYKFMLPQVFPNTPVALEQIHIF